MQTLLELEVCFDCFDGLASSPLAWAPDSVPPAFRSV